MPSYPPTGPGTTPILLYGSLLSGYLVAQRSDITVQLLTETDASDIDCVDVLCLLRIGGCVSV
jgi:hypothetical protein